jgi:hypothetical protein
MFTGAAQARRGLHARSSQNRAGRPGSTPMARRRSPRVQERNRRARAITSSAAGTTGSATPSSEPCAKPGPSCESPRRNDGHHRTATKSGDSVPKARYGLLERTALPSNNRINPVIRRSFHRSGYTPYDSAGGPAAGPVSPIIVSPAPEAPRRPATTAPGGSGAPEATRVG